MTEQERQQILDMHNQGYGDLEIARTLFYSPTYIRETLRAMGIVREPGKRCKIPLKTIKQICEMRRQGMSYRKIGDTFGMSKQTIFVCIKREEKHGRFYQQTGGDWNIG